MLPKKTDTLIVGAGPTGLTLAASLSKAGCNFVLVDKDPEGSNTSRAAVIHSNTLQELDTLDVTGTLLEKGLVVPRFSIRSRDSRLLTVDFSKLKARYPFTIMLSQSDTETVLLDRLESFGARVQRPFQVIDMAEDTDGVDVSLRNERGDHVELRARYVVGTDGMHSTVRHAARIAFDGSAYEQSFVLADVEMDWGLAEDEVNLFFSPDGLVVVAPLPGGRHRIVATMDEAPSEPSIKDVQRLLDARGPRAHRARVKQVLWSSRFRVHHRSAARYHQGRMILAGDAAHVHSPAGGQGMNTGIVDALTLAPRLIDVVAGRRSHEALDEYESLRRPVAEHVLAMSNRLTRMATVRNPALRMPRNIALRLAGLLPSVRRSIARDLSGLWQADIGKA